MLFGDRGGIRMVHGMVPCNFAISVSVALSFTLCRRDVWHGEDMAGAGQRRARWNEALLDAAVAPAYAALIQEAARLLGPCADFWRLLPLGQGSVPEPWLRVAAALYDRLADRPLLYSPVDGGKWLAPQKVLLPDAACYASRTGSSAGGIVAATQRETWEAEGGADGKEVLGLGYVPPQLRASALALLLVQCGVPLVMGLSDEQQRCMLQWGSEVIKVCRSIQATTHCYAGCAQSRLHSFLACCADMHAFGRLGCMGWTLFCSLPVDH